MAVVGDVIQAIGEGCSTATLELLGGQNALIDALLVGQAWIFEQSKTELQCENTSHGGN